MRLDEGDYLAHYGVLRRSGRYPWGSGATQHARNVTFRETVTELKKQGFSDAQVAATFTTEEHPLTSTDIRSLMSFTKSDVKQNQIATAEKLKAKGMSNVAIGKQMGLNESSVRSLLEPGAKEKAGQIKGTAEMLKAQIAEKGYIDIGVGVHHQLGISEDKFKVAVAALREEGYKKHYLTVKQLGTGNETSIRILGAPGSKQPQLPDVRGITEMHTPDNGKSWGGIKPPLSISSKRIGIRYAEDGGTDADGVMYVRPGVKDLSMGGKQYSQVRVMVDGTHYIKGMAVQKEGLPSGVDIVFNTNKSNTGNKLDALKPIKDDPENPFGSVVRQLLNKEETKAVSAMNIVNDEDDWAKWSKSLSSQVLSKQQPSLAKKQLDITYERRKKEFDELNALTNPTVKKLLLEKFADGTDAASVHMKAAALPHQSTHVIMPVNGMKKTEIYAPNYDNGTRVALIRYPHGGTFEIPELTVNNRNAEAKKLLGTQSKVAVGIHHSVAERLSGADFDGDTVLVIPNGQGLIKTQPPLAGLKGFDSKQYTIKDLKMDETGTKIIDPRYMTKANTQTEMGKITNLISDMTIKGAGREDLARAVKHSMVVIDAEKHKLDYKRSAQENGIPALKRNYQGVHEKGNLKGSATLITRAKSPEYVNERKPRPASEGGKYDAATGKKMFVETGATTKVMKTVTDPVTGKKVKIDTGETKLKKQKSTRLAETDDAHTLVSEGPGTPIERVYADHSNRLKALANESRKAVLETGSLPKGSAATRAAYKTEIDSLNSKLNVALENAPRERQAQVMANVKVRQKTRADPEMSASDRKKIEGMALADARARTRAKKVKVELTPREWEAIQAGAISKSKLEKILANTDLDKVKAFATPRSKTLLSSSDASRARAMLAGGATQAEVARQLGVSLSTLKNHI